MTTAARALEIAEDLRRRGAIYREPSGYVSIQEAAPYTGANHRFPRGVRVKHCGISVAHVLSLAGLEFGRDYPDGIQYSPWLARQLLREGYEQTVAPGAIGVIDWGGAGWGAIDYSDHVVLIVAVDGNMATCWETNTTADGRAYYYRRQLSLFTAVAMPRYRVAPTPPPRPEPVPITADPRRIGGFVSTIGG